MNDDRLVYSTDTKGVNLKKEGKAKTNKLEEVTPETMTLKLQYEKKGRGGKGVTVVLELPDNPPYFKRLMKEIKNQLGTGGTYKEVDGAPQLEFQGDCRELVRELLAGKGFGVKG